MTHRPHPSAKPGARTPDPVCKLCREDDTCGKRSDTADSCRDLRPRAPAAPQPGAGGRA